MALAPRRSKKKTSRRRPPGAPKSVTPPERAAPPAVADPDAFLKWVFGARQLLAQVPSATARSGMRKQFGLDDAVLDRVFAEARRQQEADWAERKPYARLEAIDRLRQDLAKMRQDADGGHRHAIVQAERLLADLEGTRVPVQVQHDHSVSEDVLRMLGGLSVDDVQKLAAETAERLGEERVPPRGGAA